MNLPQIGTGVVRHRRLRPQGHAFEYPTYFLMLPMRSLRTASTIALPRNRFGLLSFHDRDHGDGRADALAWLDDLLASEGIHDAAGEVWLHTYPRVLGYAFKPVSFWHCQRSDGTLAAVVVEVNNTFGERHCYLLAGPTLAYGRELQAQKVFHVSPFCPVQGNYRFRLMRTVQNGQEKTIARIDYYDNDGDDQAPLLQTSVSGTLESITKNSLRKALWCYPAMTLGVTARIHWQALKLWSKRVPFFSKPTPPKTLLTR